jgi:hypothetical protein
MSETNRIVAMRERIIEERRQPPPPLTEAQIRRIVRDEVAKLPRLRLELPTRRGGCCG